jgi:hypothetical protein
MFCDDFSGPRRVSVSRLKRQFQTELYVPWAAGTENVVGAIRSGSDQTKVGGAWSNPVNRGIRDRWMIEQVVKVRPEFGAVSFVETPNLRDGEVDAAVPGPAEAITA